MNLSLRQVEDRINFLKEKEDKWELLQKRIKENIDKVCWNVIICL